MKNFSLKNLVPLLLLLAFFLITSMMNLIRLNLLRSARLPRICGNAQGQ